MRFEIFYILKCQDTEIPDYFLICKLAECKFSAMIRSESSVLCFLETVSPPLLVDLSSTNTFNMIFKCNIH